MDQSGISFSRYQYQYVQSSRHKSAPTSKAYSQVPFEAVLKTVGWHNMYTFARHYHKTNCTENQLKQSITGTKKIYLLKELLLLMVQYYLFLLQ